MAAFFIFRAIHITRDRRDAVRRGFQNRQFPQDRRVAGRGPQRFSPIRTGAALEANLTPEQIVSQKLSRFASSRRDLTHAFALKKGITVPQDVSDFYDAVESGDWDRINSLFEAIWKKKDSDAPGAEDLRKLSAPLLETYGVAQQAHLWPADQLLEYGESILGALKPGMIYIGGTDCGRFIPTLLNETVEDGERHVVITQNMLADAAYTDYLRFVYGDQLETLSPEDSQREFSAYMADAQKRFEHDRDFPNEPKQIHPGEQFSQKDGRLAASGRTAVMAINERLLTAFMQKNEGFTFAMEESFPFKSSYGSARPLGPIFEIGAEEGSESLSGKTAQETVNYWTARAQELRSAAAAAKNEEGLKSYAHMVSAQANLLASRGFPTQAEQTYRTALEIWPGATDAANNLSDLLIARGRTAEAQALLEDLRRRNSLKQ